MRRVHHSGRWPDRQLVPDVRRRLRRPRGDHHRGNSATPNGEALRDAFTAKGAVQCGFCTPGLVVQANHVLERHAHSNGHGHAGPEEIKRGIEGNLCRCTGYKKVIEAIAAVDVGAK